MGADGTGVARDAWGRPLAAMELVIEDTKSCNPPVAEVGTELVSDSRNSNGEVLRAGTLCSMLTGGKAM